MIFLRFWMGLLFFCLLPAWVTHAQNQLPLPSILPVERITTYEGMASNEVRKIHRDQSDFMWFLTGRGLVKYTAHDCIVFQKHSRDPHSLSFDEMICVLEESNGIFWIGSRKGLNRYDSQTGLFKKYFHNPQNPKSLSDDYITALLKDQKGNLWIGASRGGLNLYDPSTESFTSFRHDPNNPKSLGGDQINRLALDPSGKIWIGTTGGTPLDRFDPETRTTEHFGLNTSEEGYANIISLYVNPDGVVWYGTWNLGLFRYDPRDNTYRNYRNDPSDIGTIASNIVQCIVPDEQGFLWIGTRGGGLCVFDPYAERFRRVKIIQKADPNASVNNILDIYKDPQNILWFGTLNDGVCKYDSNHEQIQYFKNNPKDSNTLSENRVFALCTDEDGSMWIGTDGGGLNHYDPATGQFTNFTHSPNNPNSLDSNTVISLLRDRRGNLWVGSWGSQKGPFSRYDPEKKEFKHYPSDYNDPSKLHGEIVRTLCEDFTGKIWIGSESFGVVSFDPMTEKFDNYKVGEKGLLYSTIRRIFEDSRQILWILTDQGVLCYDREKDAFFEYRPESQNSVILPQCSFLTVFEDSKNGLWFGTEEGLFSLSPDRKTLNHFTMEDGLADVVVKAILEDESGNLWISMDNGKISRFNPSTLQVFNYDKSDGLQDLAFTANTCAMGLQGELYFGGLNGLNILRPERITRNPIIPRIALTSFEVMGKFFPFEKYVSGGNPIELDYFQNYISFEFTALNYIRSHKNQYAYRLMPLESEWNYIGARRYGRYTSLEPGNYVLQMKGSNNDSVWNEEGLSVPLLIRPPFWKAWWFKPGLGILILMAALWEYRRLQNQKRRLYMEVEKRTQQLHEANRILEQQSRLDGLTQVANRRCFDEHAQNECRRALRSQTPLSILFCDVDYFKNYNDFYGHGSGDECLKKIAEVLRQSIKRPGDIVARYGGEEFVVFLTNSDSFGAAQFAEKLCRQIEALALEHESSDISKVVTVSIGVASLIPQAELNMETFLQAADRAMYQSKLRGRNRVTVWQGSDITPKGVQQSYP